MRVGHVSGAVAMTSSPNYTLTYSKILTILNSDPREAAKYVNWKKSIFDNNSTLKKLYKSLSDNEIKELKSIFNGPFAACAPAPIGDRDPVKPTEIKELESSFPGPFAACATTPIDGRGPVKTTFTVTHTQNNTTDPWGRQPIEEDDCDGETLKNPSDLTVLRPISTEKRHAYPDGSYYKGEFLDNQPNGQGEIFNSDDSLAYRGQVQNGKKHGRGTYYYRNGSRYEGFFENDKRKDRSGKYISPDYFICEASFSDDDVFRGTIEYDDGKKFEGSINQNFTPYFGEMTYPDGSKYTGPFTNDDTCLPDGYGTLILKCGTKYIGDFKKGIMNGSMIVKYRDGSTYQGYVVNNKRHGIGVLTYKDKSKCIARFVDDIPEGAGLFILLKGHKIRGLFNKGVLSFTIPDVEKKYYIHVFPTSEDGSNICERELPTEQPKEQNYRGIITVGGDNPGLYEGDVKGCLAHGQGILILADIIFEGEFQDGLLHGTVISFFPDSYLRTKSKFEKGIEKDEGYTEFAPNYDGTYLHKQRHGDGVISYRDGFKIKAGFKNGKIYRIESYSYRDGSKYEGEFAPYLTNNSIGYLPNGIGILTTANKDTIQGLFEHGQIYYGLLERRDCNNKVKFRYIGELRNGVPHGEGIISWHLQDRSQAEYIVSFENGEEKKGWGKIYNSNAEIYEGELLNGKRVVS